MSALLQMMTLLEGNTGAWSGYLGNSTAYGQVILYTVHVHNYILNIRQSWPISFEVDVPIALQYPRFKI